MNPHSFSLSSIGMTKGRAQVKLDGEDISDAVSGVGLDFSAREHPRVMLELSGVSADVVVGEAEIQLPAGVTALLQRLGWVNFTADDEAKRLRMGSETSRSLLALHQAVRDLRNQLVSGEDLPTYDGIVNTLDTMLGPWPVPNSDETSGEVSPDAVGRVIT